MNTDRITVMVGGTPAQMFQAMLLGPWLSESGGKKLGGFTAQANQQDLVILKEMVEAGKVVPVIDKCYSQLSEAPEALRYLGTGHARGKVVITVEQSGKSEHQATGDVVPLPILHTISPASRRLRNEYQEIAR